MTFSCERLTFGIEQQAEERQKINAYVSLALLFIIKSTYIHHDDIEHILRNNNTCCVIQRTQYNFRGLGALDQSQYIIRRICQALHSFPPPFLSWGA